MSGEWDMWTPLIQRDSRVLNKHEVRDLLYAFNGQGSAAITHAQYVLQSADQASLGAILQELVNDPDPIVQISTAVVLLCNEMQDATATVLPLLEHNDDVVRRYISGLLRYGDQRSIDALIQIVLTDRDPDVRYTAVTTLEEIGTPQALPALRHAHAHDTGQDFDAHSIATAAWHAIQAIEQRYSANQDEGGQ
jgi:HEAT repeat protein